MSGSGFKASIPNSVKKTIQNIKEITGNHSDEDIYAMLKECSMDPNETTQKLLLQDTFHEVKRKKDRKKEILNNREHVEPRGRPGTHGRGPRGGRGNFSPHDTTGRKASVTGKDSGGLLPSEKVAPHLSASQEIVSKGKSSGTSSAPIIANGPTNMASGTISGVGPSSSSAGNGDMMVQSSGNNNNNDVHNASPSDKSNQVATDASGTGPASSSAVHFSSSDPVLVPSDNSWFPGAAGAIRREVGSQHSLGESNPVTSAKNKLTAASETGSSAVQEKIQDKSQGVAKNHGNEIPSPSTPVTHGSPSVSRPSSNYNNRSQQQVGSQKVGSNKEWKPKPTNTSNQNSGPVIVSEAPPVSAEVTRQLQSVSSALDTEEAASKLQKKLEDFHIPQRQHVILPNHIIVPDSEKNKFCFGSLGVNFGVNTTIDVSGPDSEKSSTPLSETSQDIEETVEEQHSSQNGVVTSEVGDYPDNPQSPSNVPVNLESSEVDGSSSAIQEFNESKQDTTLPPEGHQYPGMHVSPNYGFGFVPPMSGTQLTSFDNSESQTRDVSRLPSYIVQPQVDPSYYAQFYRPGADSDGRISPFASAGATTKYNSNVAVLPTPNSQTPQEGGILSNAGQTPIATQAAGLMQSSIPVTQQPLPVYRPGVQLSHYPPNYIPYGHYFSPFYVQPPAMHQYLGNGAFPQQPQASTVYPPPPAVAAPGMKYPLPPFKPGTNAANPTHLVMPNTFGIYGSSPAGYNHNSATTAGNSASNEDLGSSQFKENNLYISGQQSEGSAVWVAAPGRDMNNLPTSSFYNLPPQGQHMTFAPTQAGHGPFTSIYHPAQAVTAATVHPLLQQSQTMAGAVDMVGQGGNVYQQPQHAQMNWPSNY